MTPIFNDLIILSFFLASNLDFSINVIINGLEEIKGVDGRLEKIDEGQNFSVIIDYAYEPGAIEKLYDTVRDSVANKNRGKIIHIIGSAGGGRDVARRPKLGALAGRYANIVIVTDEDPYDDNPETIISQVAHGAVKAGKKIDIDLFVKETMELKIALEQNPIPFEVNDVKKILSKLAQESE